MTIIIPTEYWIMIGRCVLENPDLPIEFVQELLMSKHQDRSLAEPFNFK